MYKGEKEIIDYFISHPTLTLTLEELVGKIPLLNPDMARRALESLKEKEYVSIASTTKTTYSFTEKGNACSTGVSPVLSFVLRAKNPLPLSGLTDEEKKSLLGQAKKRGLVEIKEGSVHLIASQKQLDELKTACINGYAYFKNPAHAHMPVPSQYQEFIDQRLVEARQYKEWSISYTGKKILASDFEDSFDVTVKTASASLGKNHIITQLRNRIAGIFTSMGFEEMEGGMVESAFWNFDALFQPQDHPARELADTFYLQGSDPLPKNEVVARVRDVHEKGWKYSWQDSAAMQRVLRTHTTAVSARTLASHYGKDVEKKYFAIGRVFRNEATDYKHLAEFHQVEGIIVSKNGNFRELLGTLKTFYARLGFDQIRFRPSFFPYTEPSLEIEVYFKPKKQWMELGGAGIFRPEVCKALWGNYPVLAWGLSLERPLMMLLDLDDIRTFYKNDLAFLEAARV